MASSAFKRVELPEVLPIGRGGTGSNDGSIAGSDHLVFTPAVNHLIKLNGDTELLGNFLPDLTDTRSIGSSTKWFKDQFVTQINATIFAEQTISLIGGWLVVGKNQVKLPSVTSGQTQIDFGTLMYPGDFIVIKAHDAGNNIKTEYMQIGTLVSGTTYNVTRDIAAMYVTDPAWTDGTPGLVMGSSGDGRIELNAYDTPRISIIQQGSAYNLQTEVIRLGDLNGIGGIATQKFGIYVGTANNHMQYNSTDDALIVTGRINASSGYIGGISSGWTIGSNILYGGTGTTYISLDQSNSKIRIGAKASLTDANVGVHLGSDGLALGASSVFVVTAAGALTATSATITGAITATSGTIGGFTIGTNLTNGAKTAYNDANSGIFIGATGIGLGPASTGFYVSATGALTATGVSVSGTINASAGTFTNTLYVGSSSTTGTLQVGDTSTKSVKLVGNATQGYISSGKTAYSDTTNAGFWFANNNTALEFYVGTASDAAYLKFTGSTFDFKASSFNLDTATLKITSAPKISLGTTPPTSATVGTGIWIDATGLYGLSSNVQNFKINATNGNITAIAGTVGGWTLTSSSIQTGAFDTVSTMYFGTSGISLSNTFKVTAAGVLTATGVTVSGTINATAGNFTSTVTVGNGATSGTLTVGTNATATNRITITGTDTAATTKIYAGTGTYNNTNTGFYMDATGSFSLKDKLTWDGTTLTINGGGTFSGALSAASGSFAGSLSAVTGTLGALTVNGTLTLGTGTIASTNFNVTSAGVVTATGATVTGTLNASAGTFSGNILVSGVLQTSASANTGIKISSTAIAGYNNTVQTINIAADGSGWVGLAGTKAIEWTTAGAVKAGGWNLDAGKLYNGTNSLALSLNTSNTAYISNASGVGFEVWDASSPKLFIGKKDGSRFTWNSDVANQLVIYSGNIKVFESTSGGAKIGGWDLNATQIYSGNTLISKTATLWSDQSTRISAAVHSHDFATATYSPALSGSYSASGSTGSVASYVAPANGYWKLLTNTDEVAWSRVTSTAVSVTSGTAYLFELTLEKPTSNPNSVLVLDVLNNSDSVLYSTTIQAAPNYTFTYKFSFTPSTTLIKVRLTMSTSEESAEVRWKLLVIKTITPFVELSDQGLHIYTDPMSQTKLGTGLIDIASIRKSFSFSVESVNSYNDYVNFGVKQSSSPSNDLYGIDAGTYTAPVISALGNGSLGTYASMRLYSTDGTYGHSLLILERNNNTRLSAIIHKSGPSITNTQWVVGTGFANGGYRSTGWAVASGVNLTDIKLYVGRGSAGLGTMGYVGLNHYAPVNRLTLYGGTTAAEGIGFGSGSQSTAPDTNLYRSAADTLKTDDSLIVTGSLTTAGFPLCRYRGEATSAPSSPLPGDTYYNLNDMAIYMYTATGGWINIGTV